MSTHIRISIQKWTIRIQDKNSKCKKELGQH